MCGQPSFSGMLREVILEHDRLEKVRHTHTHTLTHTHTHTHARANTTHVRTLVCYRRERFRLKSRTMR